MRGEASLHPSDDMIYVYLSKHQKHEISLQSCFHPVDITFDYVYDLFQHSCICPKVILKMNGLGFS